MFNHDKSFHLFYPLSKWFLNSLHSLILQILTAFLAIKRESYMETLQQYLLTVLPRLKHQANIAIIYAGNPSEPQTVCFKSDNPRSWKSYLSVAKDIQSALQQQGFEKVFLLEENISLAANLNHYAIDFAWLNTAGVQGIDSACHGAALLESLGIPYVGHTPANVALMDNKHLFKMFLNSQSIDTAPYLTWHPKDMKPISEHFKFSSFLEAITKDEPAEYQPKFIVKPVSGRASLNVHIAESIAELNALCQQVHAATGNTVLIEPFLAGREYCVAVMGGTFGEYIESVGWNFSTSSSPLCFALFERVLDHPDAIFTSMDHRPISGDSVKFLHPVKDAKLIANLTVIGGQIFESMKLHSIIRVDLRMDKNANLYVLEANPKPDLKAIKQDSASLIALGLEHQGIRYDAMIVNLLINSLSHLYYSRQAVASRLCGIEITSTP
jgi:D-alanine-D-alanine ligase